MILKIAEKARRQIKKLPPKTREKTYKSFKLLLKDFRHPSLKSRKMSGSEIFEARIDYHYRFTFRREEDCISVLAVGMHDEGLGKK